MEKTPAHTFSLINDEQSNTEVGEFYSYNAGGRALIKSFEWNYTRYLHTIDASRPPCINTLASVPLCILFRDQRIAAYKEAAAPFPHWISRERGNNREAKR